jgi:adenosylmethionine-8-amino-7-oxononanoate aminotransferase
MLRIEQKTRELLETDRRFLWHPFTQMKDFEPPILVAEARDCFIRDIRGRWYLDGVSSLWVNLFGHRRAELDEAIRGQLQRVAHTTLLGLANEPAVELAQRLSALSRRHLGPQAPTRVFFSDDGSTSVEVALKMAFQYWQHKGLKEKQTFLHLENSYHGDTLGAVSVGGIGLFHQLFRPLLINTLQAPSPYCYRCSLGMEPESCSLSCLAKLERILKEHHGRIAAFIVEPMVQAAGGMVFFPPGYLKGARELCRKYNVLLIADEVATGFGRTGRMFASEHEAATPDLLCLSKGISGGYLPLAATLATEELYRAFLGEYEELKTFFHGHSYTGNQLACAVALASLEVFEKDNILEALRPKAQMLKDWLQQMSQHPHVGRAQGLGLMAGLELVRDKATKEPYGLKEQMGWQVARAALRKGLFIRPLGNVVVLMPPLNIQEENLHRMLQVLTQCIREATGAS